MHSRLYVGQVNHKRYAPTVHAFRYAVFMLYIDLDELGTLFRKRWLWSATRPALARFRREDHLGDSNTDLKSAVRDFVRRQCGLEINGPIRLLTNLRYFGIGFNPVSFYYCFGEDGETLEAIVAEVNNTPWGQQYCYALPATQNLGSRQRHKFQLEKRFHVSPFMSMNIDYEWRLTLPGEKLTVHMQNHEHGRRLFDATLSMRQRPANGVNLAWALIRYPLITAQVVAAIYYQALRLKLKKTPFFPHPDKLEAPDPVERT